MKLTLIKTNVNLNFVYKVSLTRKDILILIKKQRVIKATVKYHNTHCGRFARIPKMIMNHLKIFCKI